MTKYAGAAFTALFLFAPFASGAYAQVSDDFEINLTVTAQPLISITTAPSDLELSSDGVDFTPAQPQVQLCFETNLPDIRLNITKLQPLNENFLSLVNTNVNDYISYSLSGGIIGVTAPSNFTTVEIRDYDLSNAPVGGGGCAANAYWLVLNVTPITNPAANGRAISETVSANGLDDGTPYVFSDTVTISFEPVL